MSHASHVSLASHSTNVKNFYLFYLHLHENTLDDFLFLILIFDFCKKVYIQKTIFKNLSRFKTSSVKKNFREEHTVAPLFEWVSIDTSYSLISIYIHVELHSRKKKEKKKNSTSISMCWHQEMVRKSRKHSQDSSECKLACIL